MSASNYTELALLELFFKGTAIPGIADNAGTGPLTRIHFTLNTGDPTDAGVATSNECAYSGYGRPSVTRDGTGFTSTGTTTGTTKITLTSALSFPIASIATTTGNQTATHFGIVSTSSGTGILYFSGSLSSNISVSNGVTPQLGTGTKITAD